MTGSVIAMHSYQTFSANVLAGGRDSSDAGT
jgi:hypothetical protein